MNFLYRFIISHILAFVILNGDERPYILLVSFDGFRAEYFDWYDTPNFDDFARTGVKADGLRPIFVSKTFPNHYSIVTGMYAENHGLIANSFYDEKLDIYFSLGNRNTVQDMRFYGGEPIWVTAEQQGVRSATYFWPGSEAPIKGIQPSIWKVYDKSVPFSARIDSVARWFSLSEKHRPHIITLYFHEPDGTGHRFGPTAQRTREKVEEMDALFGQLIARMSTLPIYGQLNIIVVSDHGMVSVTHRRTIELEKYVDMTGIFSEGSGPMTFLYGMDNEHLERVYGQLKNVKYITVYKKDEIPDRFHYKNHYRIKELLVLAEEGWSILVQNRGLLSRPLSGAHGYDNSLRSMEAIFLAAGPAFKAGYRHHIFEIIHIYPLMTKILGIAPNENIDGNLEEIQDMLAN